MAVFWAVGGDGVCECVVGAGCADQSVEVVSFVLVGILPSRALQTHTGAVLLEAAVALAVGLLGGGFGGLGVGLAVCTSIESNCIFVCVGGTGYTVAVGASTQRI